MFKRLIEAVPEVKFELYSFKSTIKCKEMLEQDCWFENKVKEKVAGSIYLFRHYVLPNAFSFLQR